MKEQSQRIWKYTVRRQFGFQHYHVTLFSDDCHVWDVLDTHRWDIDYTGRIKFNTQAESEKFIASVRRTLSRRRIKLRLFEKDLAL
jgi:hypothetical protein